jgi:hypothetical protein
MEESRVGPPILIAKTARRQRGSLQLEIASVALLAILVKAGSFRPKHVQSLGYSKRNVMRVLRRLTDAGIVLKTPNGYSISPKVVSKTRSIAFGLSELDGIVQFLLYLCYGENYSSEQVDECVRRLAERGKLLANSTKRAP